MKRTSGFAFVTGMLYCPLVYINVNKTEVDMWPALQRSSHFWNSKRGSCLVCRGVNQLQRGDGEGGWWMEMEETDLSKIWRIMMKARAMGSTTQRS